ncbi:MAG TPA: zinc-binding dehydrogenase [Firmicutes bacterium]|nr:zinc-binding dehydrogenase [Candidatus Fermentithermobacillaceae bacterium]
MSSAADEFRMKTAFLEAPGKMVVREVPRLELRGEGFLCEVLACGICGSDLRTYLRGPGTRRREPGHEVVLRVIDALLGNVAVPGEREGRFKPGARLVVSSVSCGVCTECLRGDEHMCGKRTHVGFEAPSGFSELAFVPVTSVLYGAVFELPPIISSAVASLVEPLACVICGHEKIDVFPGDTVVILGAGPVGCMHGIVSKMRGASQVILVDVKDSRLKLAPASSWDVKVNSAETSIEDAVLDLTGGEGASAVIVACASREAHSQAVSLTRKGGQVLLFSGLAPEHRMVPLDVEAIHRREIKLVGSRNSGRRHFKKAIDMLVQDQGGFGEIVTHVLPLEEVDRGFQLALRGEGMKVVIAPAGES